MSKGHVESHRKRHCDIRTDQVYTKGLQVAPNPQCDRQEPRAQQVGKSQAGGCRMLPVGEGKASGHQRCESEKGNDAGSDSSPNRRYFHIVQHIAELESRQSCRRSEQHETDVEPEWVRGVAGTEFTGYLSDKIKSRIEMAPHGDGAKIEQRTGDTHPSKNPVAGAAAPAYTFAPVDDEIQDHYKPKSTPAKKSFVLCAITALQSEAEIRNATPKTMPSPKTTTAVTARHVRG